METLLRQSRPLCPFLSKTSPATLRSLSTSAHRASPGGGTMSNLQVLARRCPMMGKAMAIQTATTGNNALGGVFGGVRAYGSFSGKAKLHTSRVNHATVDQGLPRHRETCKRLPFECSKLSLTANQPLHCFMGRSQSSRNRTMSPSLVRNLRHRN